MKRELNLRERKKMMARIAIEEAALRLFLEKGYENTSIEDIANAVVLSPRTFFRYFASKEDVVFASWRDFHDTARSAFEQQPAGITLYDALEDIFTQLGELHQRRRDHFYLLSRVILTTPELQPGYLYRMVSIEPLLREFISKHWGEQYDPLQIRFIAATTLTAFRVALQCWLEEETHTDLPAIIQAYMAQLKKGLFLEQTSS
uniref:TetR family transcriptional regulator n=1 Tax=Thermosporothrix sp. COM3 TaxID=2490863 RepID=A0A455SCM2_9CHLR|nr:TetR family transcriptional regulator [Thermosporothrix sp. COM3]